MDFHRLNVTGAVRFKATRSLEETAQLVGASLCMRFVKDDGGRYEEFPSFSAEAAGLSFVLLGIPPEGEQISEHRISDYCLQVGLAFRTDDAIEPCDASGFFAALIVEKSALEVIC